MGRFLVLFLYFRVHFDVFWTKLARLRKCVISRGFVFENGWKIREIAKFLSTIICTFDKVSVSVRIWGRLQETSVHKWQAGENEIQSWSEYIRTSRKIVSSIIGGLNSPPPPLPMQCCDTIRNAGFWLGSRCQASIFMKIFHPNHLSQQQHCFGGGGII